MRYPLADLLEATGLTESGLTRAVGLSGSTLVKARENGLTADAADRYATRAGFHPASVWPDWGTAECEQTCPECEEGFVPARKGTVFCSKRCRQRKLQREWQRRRYATDPAYAEAKRAARREFYAECAEYEKARERRKYRERVA